MRLDADQTLTLDMTIEDLLAVFRRAMIGKFAPVSIGQYLADLRAFFEQCQIRVASQLLAVTTTDIKEYLLGLCRGDRAYASATICRRQASLKCFFRFCQRNRLLEVNPAQTINLKRLLPNQIKVEAPRQLSVDQVQVLRCHLSGRADHLAARDWLAYELIWQHGLSTGELASLLLADLDSERGRLVVQHRGRTRVLTLMAEECAALAKYLARRWQFLAGQRDPSSALLKTKGFLLLNHHGGPITNRSIRRRLEERLEEVEIVPLNPRELRHQTIRGWLEAGQNGRMIKEQLGLITLPKACRPIPIEAIRA